MPASVFGRIPFRKCSFRRNVPLGECSFPEREENREGEMLITREEKRRKGRRDEERKEKKKKKGIEWFLPHYYFSFLPKLFGRFLEMAEPVP